MRKIIGLDVDEVLLDTITEFCRVAKERYGYAILPEQINCWDISKCTPLNAEQVMGIFTNSDVFDYPKPVPGAILATQVLKQLDWYIHVPTDRPDFHPAYRLLKRYEISFDALVLCKAAEKAVYAEQNRISVFVEDRLSTALALADVCDVVFLMARSWNECDHLPENVYRLADWWAIMYKLVGLRLREE